MTPEIKQKMREIFLENNGFAKTRDLTTLGIVSNYLKRAEELGYVIKIKRGHYRWSDYRLDGNEDLVHVAKIAPQGVICLLSALSYYGLTTYNPWEYYVAIHRDSRKPTHEGYPPIHFFFFADEPYQIGITVIEIGGHTVQIYDVEKTICDAIKYRQKIGIDIVNESVKEYMSRPGRNLNKILDYASQMKIKQKVMTYLEVMM